MSGSNGFHAWYEHTGGHSHIHVKGTVTDTDGDTTTIVRAAPQGINPKALLLHFHVEPYNGQFKPHIALQHEVTYSEASAKGAFTEVEIIGKGQAIAIKVGTAPKA
jgi:hypothetical protein